MCTDPVYGICKEPFYETITDARGGYTFSGVESGTYTIMPDAPGEDAYFNDIGSCRGDIHATSITWKYLPPR
jgi:hypothetical protein